MKTDQDLIFEAYINNEVEQDDNDQFAPEEAAADDQLGEMEPLDGEDEENNLSKIEASL